MDLYFFSKQTGGGSIRSQKRGQIGGPNPNFPSFLKIFRQNGNLPPPVDCQSEIDCAPSPVCIIRYSTSQFHRKYYIGQEEEEMKLCLMILSVPWYMFEQNAILSQFLTFITGNQVRVQQGTSWKRYKLTWNLQIVPDYCPSNFLQI